MLYCMAFLIFTLTHYIVQCCMFCADDSFVFVCILLCVHVLLHHVCASRLTRISHYTLAQGTPAG